MPLILRVDVDKPYGMSNLFKRFLSKFSENVFSYRSKKLGYLAHLKLFVQFCNDNDVNGYFYHRICTYPTNEILSLQKKGNHKIGLHAENTRSIKTFSDELMRLSKFTDLKIDSFTKHGSGVLKLGKHHYAPYEPEIYKKWANEINCNFFLGNGIIEDANYSIVYNTFYSDMFWVEHEYRSPNLKSIEKVIEIAKKNTVPIIIHPSNFVRFKAVSSDFKLLIDMAKQENIKWIQPF